MVDREKLMAQASEKLALAPFDADQWIQALRCLAGATGSSHGQLAGWMPPNRIPFSLFTEEPDGLIPRWVEIGGSDPAFNPIVRRGAKASVLEVIDDAEVISRDERRRHPIWGELYDKFDMPHLCYTTLWRDGDAQLLLTVPRSARDGVINDEERMAFSSLASRFRDAALLTQSFRNEAGRVLKGAFDAVSVAAIVLDGFERVMVVSAAAEAILREGRVMVAKRGRLHANLAIRDGFARAIKACARSSVPPSSPISLTTRGSQGLPVTIRVAPLPREGHDLGVGSAAIVIIEQAARPATASHLAPLTPAENEIASVLLQGLRPAEIAARRGASVETVRTQLKRIYSKLGVAGQVEFLSKMNSINS
jgi:DNA-binding CsgD family transcriptional regulator